MLAAAMMSPPDRPLAEVVRGPGWRQVPNAPTDAGAEPAPDRTSRLKAGGRFVLDEPAELEPVWGRGDQVLWARGEPFYIVGPSGVGKTTLALGVLGGLLGLYDEVLGYPVTPTAGRVLYLAMDRPRQIRRAMRRIFDESHREILDRRLTVWDGPLPLDAGKAPFVILEMAREAGASVVVVDSAKDAATKISDDEVGGNFNRALQALVASEIDVLVLHHQRKGQGGAKPTTLEDVYGSTWLTAGAGSVVLLWGKAGDPIVELNHLKQPAVQVGPLKVEHNHDTGQSTVYRGVADPRTVLLNAGPMGITATDLARITCETEKPDDNQRKKAQRALDRLTAAGMAVRTDAGRNADGTAKSARYHAAVEDAA